MPIHTVYVGAHDFDAEMPRRFVAEAREFFLSAFPGPSRIAPLFGLEPELARDVHERVTRRFERLDRDDASGADVERVVQDLRIDFEDGYRPDAGEDADAEEDRDAVRCAAAVVSARRAGGLPPGVGLRLRSMAEPTRRRSRRTLDRFVRGVVEGLGEWPDGFVVTLAKIDDAAEVARLAAALDELEEASGLEKGSVPVELMAETPRSIVDASGRVAVPALLDAAGGRCVGVHFGVYDYTASLGVAAHLQGPRHPVCDQARGLLQVALAGRGVELSDGSSRRVPRLATPSADSDAAIGQVAADVEHALERAVYRGWDMAPSQVVIRWLVTTAFYLRALPAMKERLAAFAGARSEDLEDAATISALRAFYRRGLGDGILSPSDLAGDLAERLLSSQGDASDI